MHVWKKKPNLCCWLASYCLHKWIANSREVLLSLPVSEVSSEIVNLELDEIPIERALGLLWNPLNDLYTSDQGCK